MRARKKLSKRMLALLLSAVMIAEPASSAMIVHATEAETALTAPEVTPEENEGATGQEGTEAPDSMDEGAKEEITDGQESEVSSPDDQENEGSDENQSDDQDGEKEENGTDPGAEEQNPDDQKPEDQNPEEQNPEDGEDVETQEPEEGAEVSEGELEESEVDEEEKTDEDSIGIMSMPSDYNLTSEQKQMKSALSASMGDFDDSAEGVQYVEKQVFTFADSREEAEVIAEAFHAELIEYDEGIAVLRLQETSVGETLRAAAAADNNLPAVYPDYYRYIHVAEEQQNDSALTVTEEEYELEGYSSDESLSEEPSLELYEQVVETLGEPNMAYDSPYYQWQHVNVGSVYAWDAELKGQGVTVAVLDSGVSGNSDVTPIADINKTTEKDANDGNGHGTHVAGIIAARLNNVGGAGIAPEANIVNVKVMNSAGSGSDSQILQGIKAAMDSSLGVDIINMSLGGLGYNPAAQLVINDAYKAGIAVFVSAGNDGGSNMCYPAAYDHVICIGATDNNNQRASFSNYGAWVDLSAPGVSIWSTGNDGGFVNMSGTSQACPVAVGEAAVILSSDKISKEKNSSRVDALESLMKKNTVSAGSGMGKGITSLTKVFNLSVASAKPIAPDITANVTDDKQSVSVTIKAQTGMTIYYTDNGKAPGFKNGVAGNGTICAESDSVTLLYEEQQKIVISAIAVNASGVPSKVVKKTFTLEPWVIDIEISGVSKIAKGKTSQLTAEVSPSYAKNKSLTWSIDEAPTGITVDNKGKVKVTNSAAPGTYKVRATANDRKDNAATGTFDITVIASDYISSVKFTSAKDTISIGERPETYSAAAEGKFTWVAKEGYANAISATDFVWSSSNKALATVDISGNVTAKAPGSVKITATANDGSNKKAILTLTIKQLATSVTITGDDYAAAGASITLKAAVSPEKVSNKKVTWTSDRADVSVKNGVVKPQAGTSGSCTITATAADGSGAFGTKTLSIKNGKITQISFDKRSMNIFRPANNINHSDVLTATMTGTGDCALNAYTCTSSNPGIATVEVADTAEDGKVNLIVTATGKATGKTTITLMATDGSKKKATCNVTVSNPVSKVSITTKTGNSGFVAKGKSLQLKAALESEYGTVSNKKVKWELYTASIDETTEQIVKGELANATNAKGVTISSSGKATAKKGNDTYQGYMIVRAIAADNGGAAGEYTIGVTNPVERIGLWGLFKDQNGNPFYQQLNTKTIYVFSQIIQTNDQDYNDENELGRVYSLDLMCDYNPVTGGFRIPAGGVTVSSSKPEVMSASFTFDAEGYPVVLLSADKPGNATITVKAMDGSGAQVKLKFKVVSP